MNKHLIFIIIACILALCVSIKKCRDIQQERNRLSDNQRALLEDVTFYMTKDSLSAAGVEKLTFTKSELEKQNQELTKTIKDLGVKLSRLQSLSTTTVETKVTITAPITDTVIIEKLLPVPAQKFNWQDNWVSVSGLIKDEQVNCTIQSIDTIVQAVHRVPKKFWFIRWGTKAIRQEILSKNPHTQITYTQYIQLKK
jgi:hypothetical protein